MMKRKGLMMLYDCDPMKEHTCKTSLGDRVRAHLKLRGRRGSNSSKHRGPWEEEEGL